MKQLLICVILLVTWRFLNAQPPSTSTGTNAMTSTISDSTTNNGSGSTTSGGSGSSSTTHSGAGLTTSSGGGNSSTTSGGGGISSTTSSGSGNNSTTSGGSGSSSTTHSGAGSTTSSGGETGSSTTVSINSCDIRNPPKCYNDSSCPGNVKCRDTNPPTVGTCNCLPCINARPCKNDTDCGGFTGACIATNQCNCIAALLMTDITADALCKGRKCAGNSDCFGLPCQQGDCTCVYTP